MAFAYDEAPTREIEYDPEEKEPTCKNCNAPAEDLVDEVHPGYYGQVYVLRCAICDTVQDAEETAFDDL